MNWKKVDETIRAYLGLKYKYHLVGVKLRKSDIEGRESQLKPEKPTTYCHIVRTAALKP